MGQKEFNYNITQTFYAKWILPFVLLIIGTLLILFFYPGTKFVKGKLATKEVKTFYKINVVVNNEKVDRYVEIKDKDVYYIYKPGSTEYFLLDTEMPKYTKHVPIYSQFRMNLAYVGIAGGIGLSTVGLFMLIVNTFKKITTVSSKTKNKIENKNNNEEDDE